MRRHSYLCFTLILLTCIRAEAETSDAELTSTFAYCAAVASAGKSASTSQNGENYFGGAYTKYLLDTVVFSSPENARIQFAAATDLHNKRSQDTKSVEELTSLVVTTLKNCEKVHAENSERINDARVSRMKNNDTHLSAQSGLTTPLEVIGMLGKPFHEDYNQDGRFVYNYETISGNDVYLFDQNKKLIRVRSYCDKLKAKCSQ